MRRRRQVRYGSVPGNALIAIRFRKSDDCTGRGPHRLFLPQGVKSQSAKTCSWRRSAHPAEALGKLYCDGSKGVSGVLPLAGFFFFLPPANGGCLRIGKDIDPLGVRGRLGGVVVVPVPPLVRRSLGITLGRILPSFLTAEGREVEVAPGGSHGLVAAAVDEVCAEHAVAVAKEDIVTVPFINAEVLVEAVGESVPGHLPAHASLQPGDIRLRRP